MSGNLTRRSVGGGLGAALVSPVLTALPTLAQSAPVKIGLLLTFSGQFADPAAGVGDAIQGVVVEQQHPAVRGCAGVRLKVRDAKPDGGAEGRRGILQSFA